MRDRCGGPARPDGRAPDELRPVTIEPGSCARADGSALIAVGETRVICTASLVDERAAVARGSGRGWLTAEYGMLPASTGDAAAARRRRAAVRTGAPSRSSA